MSNRKNRYNVYDNGNLMMENVTKGEIDKVIGCTSVNISIYAERRIKYKERYTFEIVQKCERAYKDERYENQLAMIPGFEKEWENIRRMFKNVIWVKAGGRKLKLLKD